MFWYHVIILCINDLELWRGVGGGGGGEEEEFCIILYLYNESINQLTIHLTVNNKPN